MTQLAGHKAYMYHYGQQVVGIMKLGCVKMSHKHEIMKQKQETERGKSENK